MRTRLTAAILFAIAGALTAAAVHVTKRWDIVERIDLWPLVGLSALSGAITGALCVRRIIYGTGMLRGAEVLMLAQVVFAILLVGWLTVTAGPPEPDWGQILMAIAGIPLAIVAYTVMGWFYAAPYQWLLGAIAAEITCALTGRKPADLSPSSPDREEAVSE